MQNVHEGHRDRLRGKIKTVGIENLEPHEVLEFLLFPLIPRKDTNEIAHALISEFGTLAEVFSGDADRLATVKGMTKNAAIYLSSFGDVFRYALRDDKRSRQKLGSKGQVREYMRAFLYGKRHEEVYVVALDSQDCIIRTEKLSSGSADSVALSLRKLVDFALKTNASAIIIAHSHPSGVVKPSEADYTLTRNASQTLSSIGVTLQDHLIFGGTDCFSFEENGLLK